MRFLALALAALSGMAAAQPVDEDALFSDAPTVDTTLVNKAGSVASFAGSADTSKLQVRFSGDVTALGQVNARRGSFPAFPPSDGSARMVATSSLDVSLPTRERALLTAEVAHEANVDTTSWSLREAFVDFDAGGLVWVRAGKQVLQWGRGMLWTPTDLVNVEGKTLVPRAGALEGVTGLRLLVPMGSSANLTGFVNLEKVDAADSLSGALRLEGLLGPVELAASGWAKPNRPHAAGLDASTGIRGVDLQAGMLWISGDLVPHATLVDGKWTLVQEDDHPQVRASAGIGKGFRIGGVPDRLRIDLEGFWNSRGYAADFLTDEAVHPYAAPMQVRLPASLAPLSSNPFLASFLKGDTAGDAATFALKSGLYRANQFGRAYLAGMTSLQQFVTEATTLTIQGLGNVQDGSGMVIAGLSWSGLHGFFWGVNGYWFWGDPRTEFALSGTGPAVDLRAGLRF